MTTVATKLPQPIRSTIPARLDRLRWSPFHTRLVLGLGTAWILDGLEITFAGRQPGRPAAARLAVRHPGPPEDDLRHVPDLRVGAFLGIDAEGKPLDQVARPLTAVASDGDTP